MSIKLKNYQNINSTLTIIKTKLIELQILYHNILNKMLKKNLFLSQKHQNLVLVILITGKSLKIDNKSFFFSISGFHL